MDQNRAKIFTNLISQQVDLDTQMKVYINEMFPFQMLFNHPFTFQIMLTVAMTIGAFLYREWLIAHGIKGVEELENKLADKSHLN